MSTLLHQKMENKFTVEGMEEFIRLLVCCIDFCAVLRPRISEVVAKLDQILEKETNLTTGFKEETLIVEEIITVDETLTVTLGSQLFKD